MSYLCYEVKTFVGLFNLIFITLQKFTKPLIVSADATMLLGGAVLNFLLAHQPRTPQEQLTLENIEAIAEEVVPDYDAPREYATCVKKGYPSSSMHYRCPEGTTSSKMLQCVEMVAETAYPDPFPGGSNSGTCYL